MFSNNKLKFYTKSFAKKVLNYKNVRNAILVILITVITVTILLIHLEFTLDIVMNTDWNLIYKNFCNNLALLFNNIKNILIDLYVRPYLFLMQNSIMLSEQLFTMCVKLNALTLSFFSIITNTPTVFPTNIYCSLKIIWECYVDIVFYINECVVSWTSKIVDESIYVTESINIIVYYIFADDAFYKPTYSLIARQMVLTNISNFNFSLPHTTAFLAMVIVWIKSTIVSIFIAILFLYLIIILCNSIFKFFNYKHVIWVVSYLLIIEIFLTTYMYFTDVQTLVTFEININNNLVPYNPISFNLDHLSLQFLVTIFTISFFINLYQYFYLADVINKESFFNKLNIFILSIVGVVMSNNWLLLLLAWEILGQSSFFLISFFYNKPATIKSAFKAFFFNKISDIFLILACIFYFKLNNSFIIIQKNSPVVWSSWISCFLLITAFIKSAQFIFYFWLPDSMDAPVPASALIHSATLVAAGIYLVLRFINHIELSELSVGLLLVCSTTTMVFSSLIAANQTDIKKLLAYSTISNCAFIYFLIFINNYSLALNYFMLHGFLKSISFMIAGILIKNQHHSQDMRKWHVTDLNEQILLLILIFILLLLGTTPISIMYNIKNDNIFNTSNAYINIYCSFVFCIYTLNSYIYSLKPFLFFFNKKISFNKYKNNDVWEYKYYLYLSSLIFCYLLLILIAIIYFYCNSNITLLMWNISFSLTPIFILIYLLYFNKYEYPVVLLWALSIISLLILNI